MASAQVVETSVTNNSPSQDSYHPDDLFQSRNAFVLDIPIACVVDLGAFFHAQYGHIWICLLGLSLAALSQY